MVYGMSTVSTDAAGNLVFGEETGFGDKIAAMRAAKRAAQTRGDCVPYGPSSLAYVGRDVTAIVAWREQR